MVNKAFEIIEAHYLFGFESSKIDTIINYNSYVHSIVQYEDGTYRLDAGKPDMRIPIKYALYQGLTDYQTIVTDDLNKVKKTAFGKLLITRYPIIKVAYQVIDEKGTLGAVFNASNEVAVKAFLDKKISFLGIEKIINYCLKKVENKKHPNYADLKRVDEETRALANKLVMKGGY
jgi:1-deoxy-D-xylulose-5-phosphate reductoisomerase